MKGKFFRQLCQTDPTICCTGKNPSWRFVGSLNGPKGTTDGHVQEVAGFGLGMHHPMGLWDVARSEGH